MIYIGKIYFKNIRLDTLLSQYEGFCCHLLDESNTFSPPALCKKEKCICDIWNAPAVVVEMRA